MEGGGSIRGYDPRLAEANLRGLLGGLRSAPEDRRASLYGRLAPVARAYGVPEETLPETYDPAVVGRLIEGLNQSQNASALKGVDDAVRGVADSVTFGLADEAAAAADALTGRAKSYDEALAYERQRDAEGGALRFAGQIGGAFLPLAGGPVRAGFQAAAKGAAKWATPEAARALAALASETEGLTRFGKIATGAANAAAGGALYGFGSGEGGLEGRTESAGVNAVIGGVLGGAGGSVAGSAGPTAAMALTGVGKKAASAADEAAALKQFGQHLEMPLESAPTPAAAPKIGKIPPEELASRQAEAPASILPTQPKAGAKTRVVFVMQTADKHGIASVKQVKAPGNATPEELAAQYGGQVLEARRSGRSYEPIAPEGFKYNNYHKYLSREQEPVKVIGQPMWQTYRRMFHPELPETVDQRALYDLALQDAAAGKIPKIGDLPSALPRAQLPEGVKYDHRRHNLQYDASQWPSAEVEKNMLAALAQQPGYGRGPAEILAENKALGEQLNRQAERLGWDKDAARKVLEEAFNPEAGQARRRAFAAKIDPNIPNRGVPGELVSPLDQEAVTATMDAIERRARSLGWRRNHVSESRFDGRRSSRYIQPPNGNEVRLSDHDLPNTPSRNANGGNRWAGSELVIGDEWRNKPIDYFMRKVRLLGAGTESSYRQDALALRAKIAQARRNGELTPAMGKELEEKIGRITAERLKNTR